MHRIIDPPQDQWHLFPTPLSAGEYAAAELFGTKLDSEWEMYIQPHLNGLRPDIVLLNPFAGIGVFEIKDWKLSTLRYKVSLTTVQNPIRKIQLYKEEIHNLYCPRLNEALGKAAVTAGLIFTDIPQVEVERTLISVRSQGMKSFPSKYPISGSERVSVGNIDAVFPEHRTWGKERRSRIMTPDTAEDLRGWLKDPDFSQEQRMPLNLNSDQREIAEVRTASGYRRVKGPAGSGKSLALAARAAVIAMQRKHVLVCTYNITLINYLHDLVSRHLRFLVGQQNPQLKVFRKQIDYRHFHGWCKWICTLAGFQEDYNRLWTQFPSEEVLNVHLAELVAKIYSNAGTGEILPRYDAVLVDEGQDYRLDWWKTLRSAVKPGGEMLLVADKTQDVYGTAASLTEQAMRGSGFSGPWKELRASHRLPPEMEPVLSAFADSHLLPSGVEVDLPTGLQLEFNLYDAPELRWVQVRSHNSLTEVSFEEVRRQMKLLREDTSIPDIVFLAQDNKLGLEFVKRCKKENIRVRHTFGKDTSTGQATDSIRNKKESSRMKLLFFLGAERIKATTVHSFKGWEARHLVLQINKVETPEDCALFYTALTRLKKHRNGGMLTVVSSSQDLSNFGRINFPQFFLR